MSDDDFLLESTNNNKLTLRSGVFKTFEIDDIKFFLTNNNQEVRKDNSERSNDCTEFMALKLSYLISEVLSKLGVLESSKADKVKCYFDKERSIEIKNEQEKNFQCIYQDVSAC